jgi:tetratricopeptide (TPR) repeat protein
VKKSEGSDRVRGSTGSGIGDWRKLLVPAGIFCLAFVLRLIYLLEIQSSLPFFYALRLDELYHDTWARQIASGDWLGTEPFFRAPLYAYLLALTYKIFGHTLFIPRLFQILMGSLSCVLIFLIAKSLFNRFVGILSGVIAALYAMLILYDAHLLITSLAVFLDLVLMYLLLRAGKKPKPLNWFYCGIIVGFSALARPNILVFVPFILIWMFYLFKSRLVPKAILTCWIILCAGALLIIAPVAVRNYLVGKDLVLIAWQGGYNFYLGNNPQATGWSTMAPQMHRGLSGGIEDATTLAEKETQRELKPSQISGFWYRKGISSILSQPAAWLELMGRKTLYFWKGYEIPNAQNAYLNSNFSGLLGLLLGTTIIYIPFGLVGPLSILGLLICIRRIREYLLLYLFVISYSASVIIFFVCSRFRMPVIPILIMFASFSLWWLYQKIKKRQIPHILVFLLVLVLLLPALNTRLENLTGDQRALDHFALGSAYQELGQSDLAVKEWRTSLRYNPNVNLCRTSLADLYFNQGLIDSAMNEYNIALLSDTSYLDRAYLGLALINHRREDRDRAIEYYLKSIEINPRFEFTHLMLGHAYHEKGLVEKAKEEWKKVLELNPDNQDAIRLLRGG